MSLRTANEMRQAFKLPMVPGVASGEELMRRNYRKGQTLTRGEDGLADVKDVPIDFNGTATSANVASSPHMTMGTQGRRGTWNQIPSPAEALRKTAVAGTNPVENGQSIDRQVLRFFSYFAEPVSESRLEKERVRRVVLCYFLEDGTVSVSEPRQDNSGIVQGSLLKRHQVPRQGSSTDLITYQDFALGCTVSFYGRTYMIVDCDEFTRQWMNAQGVDMDVGGTAPEDEFTMSRLPHKKPMGVDSVRSVMNSQGMKVKLSASEVRATQQFLQKDRQVLRCFVAWDDTTKLYGAKRLFTLYYFLADDTIEVVEKYPSNSGRDPFPSFCRRQKVVRPPPGSTHVPVANAALTVGGREGVEKGNTYNEQDLMVGNTVIVVGRPFLIYGWDKYTQQHMRKHFGVTDYAPINVTDPRKPVPPRVPPPPNGFGNDEDSLSSWRSLDLKAPRKDMSGYHKYGDSVVKFALKLDNGEPNDAGRRFVLSLFVADKTLQIFEVAQRNSGFTGGKFLQRKQVKNPETGKPWVASDVQVGQRITINGFKFHVFGTDDRSMTFMEHHSSDFPGASIDPIVAKIRAMLLSKSSGLVDALIQAEANSNSNGVIDLGEIATVFERLALPVTEQEILCVLRYFDANGDGSLTYTEIVGRLQEEPDTPGSDPRCWQEILGETSDALVTQAGARSRVEEQSSRVEATTAAYAARQFLEAFETRRRLFLTEFKFVTDYSLDELIGEPEFRKVMTEKLPIGLTPQQLDALCVKLFPPKARRVTLDEFTRLLNNTSNLDHNLAQIRSRRE